MAAHAACAASFAHLHFVDEPPCGPAFRRIAHSFVVGRFTAPQTQSCRRCREWRTASCRAPPGRRARPARGWQQRVAAGEAVRGELLGCTTISSATNGHRPVGPLLTPGRFLCHRALGDIGNLVSGLNQKASLAGPKEAEAKVGTGGAGAPWNAFILYCGTAWRGQGGPANGRHAQPPAAGRSLGTHTLPLSPLCCSAPEC